MSAAQHTGKALKDECLLCRCSCRPVSDPFGFLLGAGPPVETPKSKQAWAELVKGLRVRGPASKGDPSLAAGLMRMTGAGGESASYPPCPAHAPSRVTTIA